MSMLKPLKSYPKRGEVYVADLNPGSGREIHKKRPVLIISSNLLNENSFTVIMVPLSSIVPKNLSFDMIAVSDLEGLHKKSVILVDQIRSVDRERLLKKIGVVSKEKMFEVEDALKLVLGMTALD